MEENVNESVPVNTTATTTWTAQPVLPKPSKLPWIILGILVIAFGIGVWFVNQKAQPIYAGTYDAVFLTNSQTYYGKLIIKNDTLELNKVYTIQTVQNGSTTQPSLVYAGDRVTFEKQGVIGYEELASTSPILNAIKK